MSIDDSVWEFFQQHLGYTDAEMQKFKEDPRNEHILSKAGELMNKTIVIEVVDSQGCNSQHKLGDKFYLDGAGNLISKLCPKRMCAFAVSSFGQAVFGLHELFYAGADPNQMHFKRFGCTDVGIQCGGWGKIVMEIRMEERTYRSEIRGPKSAKAFAPWRERLNSFPLCLHASAPFLTLRQFD